MECPYGCGDMKQLVSITKVINQESDEIVQKYVQVIYEQCDECGHEESVDIEVVDDKTRATRIM